MELFHQLIYEQFALYVPSFPLKIYGLLQDRPVNGFIPGGLLCDWLKET